MKAKIEEVRHLITANRNKEIEYKAEYIALLERQLDAYEKEYAKALKRKEPGFYQKSYNEDRIGWSYGKGQFNTEGHY